MPPNCIKAVLPHYSDRNSAIDLAMFNDHRFAFFFWAQWQRKIDQVPDLVTIDWHQDLIFPVAPQESELKALELAHEEEVAYFSWARLRSLNDSHVLAAAYLNLIGDIWVLCKDRDNWEEEELIDHEGNTHTIRKFLTLAELINDKQKYSGGNPIFLDLDLDYFTVNNRSDNADAPITFEPKEQIKEFLSLENHNMSWLLNRTEGITIALEPEHTGSIRKSMELMTLVEDAWFANGIGDWDTQWRTM